MSEHEVVAEYDQLISTPIYDNQGNIIRRRETFHFTFGKLGSPIAGGFYITAGTLIPEKLSITVPSITRVGGEKDGDNS